MMLIPKTNNAEALLETNSDENIPLGSARYKVVDWKLIHNQSKVACEKHDSSNVDAVSSFFHRQTCLDFPILLTTADVVLRVN